MSRGVSEKTKKLTASALISAIGVVILMLGAFIEVLDLSMAALASFFCIFAVIELGKGYPWMIYAVTGILSVLLMPQGLGGWFYILFFGYYPIAKEKFEKLKKPLSWGLKIIVFNIATTLYALVCYFLFFGEYQQLLGDISSLFGGVKIGAIIIMVVYIVLDAVFVIYDIALTRLISFYYFRLRRKFRFLK